MANPNQTVRNWRRKVGFPERERRPISPFMEWFVAEVRKGRTFETIEQAEAEYKISMEKVCNG